MTFATKVVKQQGTNDILTGTGTPGQTGSATVAYVPTLWTFNLNQTPVEGDHLTIKVPETGVNSGIWMSTDNGTTYYPVAAAQKTRLTTQFPVDETVTLIFQTGRTTSTVGTTIDGAPAGSSTTDVTLNRWAVINFYDTDTTYSSMSQSEANAGTKTTARSISAKVLSTAINNKLTTITNTEIDNLFT